MGICPPKTCGASTAHHCCQGACRRPLANTQWRLRSSPPKRVSPPLHACCLLALLLVQCTARHRVHWASERSCPDQPTQFELVGHRQFHADQPIHAECVRPTNQPRVGWSALLCLQTNLLGQVMHRPTNDKDLVGRTHRYSELVGQKQAARDHSLHDHVLGGPTLHSAAGSPQEGIGTHPNKQPTGCPPPQLSGRRVQVGGRVTSHPTRLTALERPCRFLHAEARYALVIPMTSLASGHQHA